MGYLVKIRKAIKSGLTLGMVLLGSDYCRFMPQTGPASPAM